MQSSGIPLRSPVLRLGSPHKLIHLSLANKPHHSRRWNALSVPLLPDPQIEYCDEVITNGAVEKRVFYVKDNGIGIAREFHDDIFRIFKRLNTEDPEKMGTGMGLTFVRRIVERDGGQVCLDSTPGEGSTFYFTMNLGDS